MALKTRRIYVTVLRDGQTALHPSDGRGTRFKMLATHSKMLRPKASDAELGREIRRLLSRCK